MKRAVFFVVLMSLGLADTGYAATGKPGPGCNPAVMDVMTHQMNAVAVRNRAYEREMLGKNDSTLRLTCYDQAMRLSARLGYIFSDVHPASPPLANSYVFTSGLNYSGWGAQRYLATDLNRVVPVVYDDWIKNFPPASTPPDAIVSFAALVQPTINAIATFQKGETNIDSLVTQIEKAMASLDSVPLASIPSVVTGLRTLVSTWQDDTNNILDQRKSAMNGFLDTAKDLITGKTTAMDCTRLDDVWANGNTNVNVNFPPVENYVAGTPYYGLHDFLNANIPGAAAAFSQELLSDGNAPVVSAAWGDLAGLKQPGLSQAWPETPSFNIDKTGYAPNVKASDIINTM